MERQWETGLWCAVVLLAFALLCYDAPAQPARANDSAGRMAAASPQGSFFLVDTENQWIGLYAQPNNSGPRLVSAQNYQYASVLATMRSDSLNQPCETATGLNVVQVRQALEKAAAEQR